LFVLAQLLALAGGRLAWAGNWPQWRGPTGDSVSPETGLPLTWGDKSGLLWTCPLPGEGASTPAVWGDAVFVTAQHGKELVLLKVDARKGRVEWSRTVGTGSAERMPLRAKRPDERRRQMFHALHNLASPSPVTDGEVVVVHFGNGDLAAYDFAGKQLWKRNLQKDHGPYTIWWGHANSPVLHGELVISACMQDSLADLGGETASSYLVAHDRKTGAQKWKTERKTEAKAEQCDSYTTPLLRRVKGGTELVVMGGNQLDGYDADTGKLRWYLPGVTGGRTITGPTLAGGTVYATQGMRGPLLAVRLGGEGRLADRDVAWRTTDGTPDSPCPVVWKGLLFYVSDNGVARCRDARTGEQKWQQRLGGDYKASPVAADGRVYFLSRTGVCTVVAAAARYERLAVNRLDDATLASPAVAGGRIYLRGHKALYCAGK
jgi:outer membrane protein assembly factor BamB